MRTLTFKMPLFPSTVRVFFSLEAFLKRYPSDYDYGHYKAFVCTRHDGVCMVFKPEYFKESLLAHESVHAAWYVLDYAQVKVDFTNDEPLAYAVEHIYEQVYRHWKKESAKCD